MRNFFFGSKQKLKESEIRYRRLFESAKDGILILDFESGKITDANPYIVEIIDRPLNKIIGEKLWEIGLFSNKEESKQAFEELKMKGYVRFDDMPIQKQNGKITEVEFVSNVYIENNKKVIQCNIRNITERKHILRRQKLTTRILTILNNLDNWDLSIKNIIEEIKSFTDIEIIDIHLKTKEAYLKENTVNFHENYTNEVQNLCQLNGKDEITVDYGEAIYLEDHFDMVISGRTDPTLSCFTEGGSFYSNNFSGILKRNNENQRQIINPKVFVTKGYESVALIPLYCGNDILGLLQLNDKRPGLFSLETLEFLEKTGNTIGIAYTRVKNEIKIKESEQNFKKQNEEYIHLNKEYLVLNIQLNKSIVQIQNINSELIAARTKAEESEKLKSAFLHNISHEIRTPLNAIMGFSGFILDPKASKSKFEAYVKIINTSGSKLLSIINDIIDISKIETNQINLRSELVNINTLMTELFNKYKLLVNSEKIRLHYADKSNDQIYIKTDESRIKQVFHNLLNNALKFTESGEIEFGYKVDETMKASAIQFYVKDTGIGIAEENHQLIFERFRQVESNNTKMYGGNGLGLSISKALVEKMGGTIKVISRPGDGSTFIFTIPTIKNAENNINHGSINEKFPTENWNAKTVLIVEDEINNHKYLEELLSETKINIIHAWGGQRAVDFVKSGSLISLVLMDIKMPIMDGYEAMTLIKQIRPEIPVIAQTASMLSNEKSQALESGFDDYISKPIEKHKLLKLMGKYLNN